VLFLLEIKVLSHGLLTIGGIVSLFLGSIMLITPESSLDMVSLSWTAILGAIGFSTLFFLFIIGLGIRAQRAKPVSGMEGIIGETGEALTELSPTGTVRVHGEIWAASSNAGTIASGDRIVVDSFHGLHLIVGRTDSLKS
jgi:membrane-bound serine protease (ClpP class)